MQQVVKLTVQLGLGSILVDWYRDATSVPFGRFLIDLSPRADGRLRYCTNSGNITSKFYVPDHLKHLKSLDDGHTNFLYSPSIATRSSRMQNSVSKNLFKRIYPISQRVHRQPVARKRKLVRSKKSSRAKQQRQKSQTVHRSNYLEASRKSTFVTKGIIARENNFPSHQ